MKAVFDVYDKFDCRCSDTEVGQPWHYRWGVADAKEGLCLYTEVGTARPPDEVIKDEEGHTLGTLPSSGVVAEMERALALGGSSLESEAVKHSNVLAIIIRHKLEQEDRLRMQREPLDLTVEERGNLSASDFKGLILKLIEDDLIRPEKVDEAHAMVRSWVGSIR